MSKKTKKHKDFIEFESEMVRFLNAEQTKIAAKFGPIIAALRENKYLTVKEIHDLYIDEDTNKHTYTIKTIYRYLEKLEETDLVKIGGHRITEGLSLTEKLYTRTANIFFKAKKEEIHPEVLKHRKEDLKRVFKVLEQVEGKPKIDFNLFEELLLKKMDLEQELNRKITAKIPEDKILTELYSSLHIDSVNYISDLAATILVISKHPEIFEKLSKMY